MGKEYVDDDPFALFKRAEGDVAGINALLKNKDVPEDFNYESICFHATQAVEKFLKGFIVENKGMVKKTHKLDYVQNIAESINKYFFFCQRCIVRWCVMTSAPKVPEYSECRFRFQASRWRKNTAGCKLTPLY